jgi:tRNA-modifying protein YgfZ
MTTDQTVIQATQPGVALYDRSHWGRIEVADADRINFLHNQSTNDFKLLKSGQGCDTVFVTSTARTIDLAAAYILEDTVLLLVSPEMSPKLIKWLDRYIFFADKVKLTDITTATIALSLIGPQTDALLEKLGATAIIGQPQNHHQAVVIAAQSVRIAVGSGLALPGYTLIANADQKATLWSTLIEMGAQPIADAEWEQLRISQGRPLPDRELTDDYNPLEAGLWHMISFNKGCYIGQETIARLDTYKGVKQQLWGINLTAPVTPGTLITVGAEKAGILTSVVATATGWQGLAYIKTKVGGAGLTVQVGDATGEIVDLPGLTHTRLG